MPIDHGVGPSSSALDSTPPCRYQHPDRRIDEETLRYMLEAYARDNRIPNAMDNVVFKVGNNRQRGQDESFVQRGDKMFGFTTYDMFEQNLPQLFNQQGLGSELPKSLERLVDSLLRRAAL